MNTATTGKKSAWRLFLPLLPLLALLAQGGWASWYTPGQVVQYPAPAVYPYPAAQQYVPYGQPAAGYVQSYGQPAAGYVQPAPQTYAVQPPPVVLNLPDTQYYYALPTGAVVNPTQPVVMPYPVYYYDPNESWDGVTPAPQATPAKPAATATATGRYAVLAGSFLEENLAQLSERYIQALGFTSYRQHLQVKDKQFTRVFAGPFAQKKEAVEASKNMQARYNLPGVVVPYRP